MSNIERFNLRIDRLACGEAYSMQPQDGGPWIKYEDHTASVASLQAQVKQLREALEPFKTEADKWPDDVEDGLKIACCSDITVGNLRVARAMQGSGK